jgi:heat shock protein HslJ
VRRIIGVLVACGVAALLPIVVGCGSSASNETPDLDGSSWRLSSWSVSSQDPADFTITAAFKDGTIAGNAAVNTYNGSYTVGPNDAFSAGPLATTKMAGPEADMQAETTYLQLLEAAKTCAVDGEELVLFDADGNESLRYVAQ